MADLEKILTFTKLLNEFRNVERMILIKGSDRKENDSEHSYSLAMLAWYVTTTYNLPFDKEKILKYALVHDLVEVYAGDTYTYTEDKALLDSKEQREKEAAERLKKEFPEFEDLHKLIHEYEQKSDEESKLIYALDKIEPMLYIYLDSGRLWKKRNITLRMIIEHKTEKISVSPTIKKIYDELLTLLEKDKNILFNS